MVWGKGKHSLDLLKFPILSCTSCMPRTSDSICQRLKFLRCKSKLGLIITSFHSSMRTVWNTVHESVFRYGLQILMALESISECFKCSGRAHVRLSMFFCSLLVPLSIINLHFRPITAEKAWETYLNYNLWQRLYSRRNGIRGSETINWKPWCWALHRIWKTLSAIDSLVRKKRERENTPNYHFEVLDRSKGKTTTGAGVWETGRKKPFGSTSENGSRSWTRFFFSLGTSCVEWYLTKWTDKSNVWCDVAVMETNVHWNT